MVIEVNNDIGEFTGFTQRSGFCEYPVQTLRDNGTLAYTQISHKTYYKPEDVMAIVAVVEDRKTDMRFRKRTGWAVNIQQPLTAIQQVKRVR